MSPTIDADPNPNLSILSQAALYSERIARDAPTREACERATVVSQVALHNFLVVARQITQSTPSDGHGVPSDRNKLEEIADGLDLPQMSGCAGTMPVRLNGALGVCRGEHQCFRCQEEVGRRHSAVSGEGRSQLPRVLQSLVEKSIAGAQI